MLLTFLDPVDPPVLQYLHILVPDLADPFNSLREMQSSAGDYFRVTESASVSLAIEEIPQCNSQIDLHAGCNWIGGPCAVSPVETALESIARH